MPGNGVRKNFGHSLRSWRFNHDGSTAVEFALIGIPFLFMVIGIIEMALMFTAQSLLEASTAEAAREIRTGAVQQGGGENAFTDTLCDFAAVLIPCGDIQYQVVALEDFGSAEEFPDAQFDEDGNLEDQQFDPGGVSDVVMIRVAYKYPIKTPMMQFVLTNNNDNSRVMLSTIVLQTEPYEFEE
jgi:Flp pilus assembly protein TadG